MSPEQIEIIKVIVQLAGSILTFLTPIIALLAGLNYFITLILHIVFKEPANALR